MGWEPVPGPGRRRWPAVVAVAALLATLGLVIGSLTVTLPYYALAPGGAYPVDDLVRVPDGERHPPEGDFLLTTVSLRRVRPVDVVQAWLRSDVELVDEERIRPPDVSDREYQRQNVELMDESRRNAVVVALRALGHPVPERGTGARVTRTVAGTPAEGNLAPDDVVVAVGPRPVAVVSDLQAAVRERRPGDLVRLEVEGADGTGRRTVELRLGAHPDTGVPFVGVELQTRDQSFDLPLTVEIDAGTIGGPSAGLAFALGVIDVLTPGELTGGHRVAVTGEIRLDGTVGDVGGVALKTAAVRRSGADVFLVPPGELAEARAHAGNRLRVVAVGSLQDALRVLEGLGGDVSALARRPGAARQ